MPYSTLPKGAVFVMAGELFKVDFDEYVCRYVKEKRKAAATNQAPIEPHHVGAHKGGPQKYTPDDTRFAVSAGMEEIARIDAALDRFVSEIQPYVMASFLSEHISGIKDSLESLKEILSIRGTRNNLTSPDEALRYEQQLRQRNLLLAALWNKYKKE